MSVQLASDLSFIRPVGSFEEMPPLIIAKISPRGDCWIWTGRAGMPGRRVFRWNGRMYKITRLIYALLVGSPPIDRHLVRICRVADCVNPDHMNLEMPGWAGGEMTARQQSTVLHPEVVAELIRRHPTELEEIRSGMNLTRGMPSRSGSWSGGLRKVDIPIKRLGNTWVVKQRD